MRERPMGCQAPLRFYFSQRPSLISLRQRAISRTTRPRTGRSPSIPDQDEHLRFLDCQRVQADEIWAHCYAKARNVPENKREQPI